MNLIQLDIALLAEENDLAISAEVTKELFSNKSGRKELMRIKTMDRSKSMKLQLIVTKEAQSSAEKLNTGQKIVAHIAPVDKHGHEQFFLLKVQDKEKTINSGRIIGEITKLRISDSYAYLTVKSGIHETNFYVSKDQPLAIVKQLKIGDPIALTYSLHSQVNYNNFKHPYQKVAKVNQILNYVN